MAPWDFCGCRFFDLSRRSSAARTGFGGRVRGASAGGFAFDTAGFAFNTPDFAFDTPNLAFDHALSGALGSSRSGVRHRGLDIAAHEGPFQLWQARELDVPRGFAVALERSIG